MAQEFSLSTKIFFGENALERLREVANRKVLIVTDGFMRKSGIADRVASWLTDCTVTVFSDVVSDPTIEVVAAGIKCLRECRAEVMIAIGGGSAIDAAKAIREIARQKHLLETDIVECFAIPTTSGTGSEVTEYAVISDAEKGIKYPLVSKDMRPPVAILDPSLVVSAPPVVTADSGMDVLTHAIEAYVSTGASDFTDALAEKAVEMVVRHLPECYKNGGNLFAREKMHNASCMAGLAFNSAGLGLCHGLAHAIGAKFHISHGRANAMLLPHVTRFNAFSENHGSSPSPAAEKYKRLARLLDLPAATAVVGVNQLIHTVENLSKAMQIPSSLKMLNIDQALVSSMEDDIIDLALKDITTASNPRTPSDADIRSLLGCISR